MNISRTPRIPVVEAKSPSAHNIPGVRYVEFICKSSR